MRLKTVDTLKTKNARDPFESRAFCYRLESVLPLDSGNVLRLPALVALGHIELHGLAFLQALETASLNRGEMDENVGPRESLFRRCSTRPRYSL